MEIHFQFFMRNENRDFIFIYTLRRKIYKEKKRKKELNKYNSQYILIHCYLTRLYSIYESTLSERSVPCNSMQVQCFHLELILPWYNAIREFEAKRLYLMLHS